MTADRIDPSPDELELFEVAEHVLPDGLTERRWIDFSIEHRVEHEVSWQLA